MPTYEPADMGQEHEQYPTNKLQKELYGYNIKIVQLYTNRPIVVHMSQFKSKSLHYIRRKS